MPGENSKEEADKLAEALRGTMKGRDSVRIGRPEKKGEIRINGLEPSTTENEIKRSIAKIGECTEESVQLGPIRNTARGLGTVWARCPLRAAVRVGREGKLQIGWGMVGAELLEERPLQCYRCLQRGHVRAQCKGEKDRSGACYRCGAQGHRARDCGAPEHCILCEERGRPAAHRTEGKLCPSTPKRIGIGAMVEGGKNEEGEGRTPVGSRQETYYTPLPQRERLRGTGMQMEIEVKETSIRKGNSDRQQSQEEAGSESHQ